MDNGYSIYWKINSFLIKIIAKQNAIVTDKTNMNNQF